MIMWGIRGCRSTTLTRIATRRYQLAKASLPSIPEDIKTSSVLSYLGKCDQVVADQNSLLTEWHARILVAETELRHSNATVIEEKKEQLELQADFNIQSALGLIVEHALMEHAVPLDPNTTMKPQGVAASIKAIAQTDALFKVHLQQACEKLGCARGNVEQEINTLYEDLSTIGKYGNNYSEPLILAEGELGLNRLCAVYALFSWASDDTSVDPSTGEPVHCWKLPLSWSIHRATASL